MVTRREWLAMTAGAGAALTVQGCMASAEPGETASASSGTSPSGDRLVMRAIPKTGERLPVVGLGSAATFSAAASREDKTALKEVMKTMVELGGRVFDTAPGYGASEQVAGDIANELGIAGQIFWATKVNVARGGSADPAAARAQIEASFQKFRVPKIDLIQVHNLGDVPTQLGILKELKQQGRIRYTGVTTTSDNQYTALEQIMRNEPIDFIEVDYSIANRNVEETILPLAIERKIGVLVALPFGRASLFGRVAGKALPPWAADIDVSSWAQYFLKYIVGHPAITVAIPSTTKPANMQDNMGGALGRLPDQATRVKMIAYFDSVATPAATGRGGRGG